MIGNNPFFKIDWRAKKQNGQQTLLIHFHKTMQPRIFSCLTAKLSDASQSLWEKLSVSLTFYWDFWFIWSKTIYICVYIYIYMYTHAVDMDSFKAVYRLRNTWCGIMSVKEYSIIAGYKITVISNLLKIFDLCNLKYFKIRLQIIIRL